MEIEKLVIDDAIKTKIVKAANNYSKRNLALKLGYAPNGDTITALLDGRVKHILYWRWEKVVELSKATN